MYLLGWRSFCRYSLVYQSLPCHTCQISPSPPPTHPVPPCIFHIIILRESYSLLLCHTGTYLHPCPPPPDYWYISFFLVGPGPLHKIAASVFSRSPLRRANTFSFQYLPSTPRISLSVSPLSPYFGANLSLSFIMISFTHVLYPPDFSIDSTRCPSGKCLGEWRKDT